MTLIRKIRKTGNSISLTLPNEIFDFLNLNPLEIKYKLSQDDKGNIFILILNNDVMALDEKKFQKQGNRFSILLPKVLCTIWNVGFDEGQKREIGVSLDKTPLKWLIRPV